MKFSFPTFSIILATTLFTHTTYGMNQHPNFNRIGISMLKSDDLASFLSEYGLHDFMSNTRIIYTLSNKNLTIAQIEKLFKEAVFDYYLYLVKQPKKENRIHATHLQEVQVAIALLENKIKQIITRISDAVLVEYQKLKDAKVKAEEREAFKNFDF